MANTGTDFTTTTTNCPQTSRMALTKNRIRHTLKRLTIGVYDLLSLAKTQIRSIVQIIIIEPMIIDLNQAELLLCLIKRRMTTKMDKRTYAEMLSRVVIKGGNFAKLELGYSFGWH